MCEGYKDANVRTSRCVLVCGCTSGLKLTAQGCNLIPTMQRAAPHRMRKQIPCRTGRARVWAKRFEIYKITVVGLAIRV